jgi:hypothetical protein
MLPSEVINLFQQVFQTYPLPKQFSDRNMNYSQGATFRFQTTVVQEYLRA